jgi:hypothetical protein
MAKIKRKKGQAKICKTLSRKHEPHWKRGVNSGAPEG